MKSIQLHAVPSLMVVEDEDAARDILFRLLSKSFPNSTIYTAMNGQEGVELFKKHTPEIVITDINMPVMNGFDMVRAIKSINAQARYIFLTARNDKDTIGMCEKIGSCACLMKPLDFDEFLEAIEKCSDGRLLVAR